MFPSVNITHYKACNEMLVSFNQIESLDYTHNREQLNLVCRSGKIWFKTGDITKASNLLINRIIIIIEGSFFTLYHHFLAS